MNCLSKEATLLKEKKEKYRKIEQIHKKIKRKIISQGRGIIWGRIKLIHLSPDKTILLITET